MIILASQGHALFFPANKLYNSPDKFNHMGAETKEAIIYRERPEHFVIPPINTDTVVIYGETEDGEDQFALDTEVDHCNLEDGQDVQVVIYSGTVFDKDGKLVTLPAPMIQGVWHERCVYCKYNPYSANSVKQCNACRKP